MIARFACRRIIVPPPHLRPYRANFVPPRKLKTFRPFMGMLDELNLKKPAVEVDMAEEPARATAGRVHALQEAEMEMPVEKKARVEMEVELEAEAPEVKVKEEAAQVQEKPEKKKTQADKRNTRRRKQKKVGLPEACSPEDVMWKDIVAVLGQEAVDKAMEAELEFEAPFVYHQELELEVRALGSNGDGIAVAPDAARPWAVIVPLVLPGEKIRVRIYRDGRMHSYGDLLEVLVPNTEMRDDSRVQCKYFGSCAGCQYQMLSYETQLDLKRNVVVKAYKNYSNIPESSMPQIGATVASPLDYGYRTKLTPHFEAPPKSAKHRKAALPEGEKPDWLQIGFNKLGTHKTLDIEECPIATPVINAALGPARENIIKNIHTYKKGVSLIFRDSLDTSVSISPDAAAPPVDVLADAFNKRVCVTDHKAPVRETVGGWIFEYTGGSFFQNNNSVLVPLTEYVREAMFPSSSSGTEAEHHRPTHLVDTYCGAGLFAISLSPHFTQIAGIELSADSIRSASLNASLNRILPSKISFRAGDASAIFAAVPDFPAGETVVLVDPPRKGCDVPFLEQLWAFRPRVVVYVSCNVHTQARDVGWILKKGEEERVKEEAGGKEGGGKGRYVLESVRGFDLFPQTAHVESVAVLRLA